jgi:hypothetical protein
MDTYEALSIARQFKLFRDALAVAFVICAILFREELVAVIMYISQEHARHVVERLLEVSQGDRAASS